MKSTELWQLDPVRELRRIVKLCTRTARVWYIAIPWERDWSGEHAQWYVAQYDAIVPIFGGYPRPCLFHCYGLRRELGQGET